MHSPFQGENTSSNLVGAAKINNDPGRFLFCCLPPRFELVQFVREVGENTHCVFEPYEPKGARHAARHGGNYNLVGAAKINNDPFGSFFILLSAPGRQPRLNIAWGRFKHRNLYCCTRVGIRDTIQPILEYILGYKQGERK